MSRSCWRPRCGSPMSTGASPPWSTTSYRASPAATTWSQPCVTTPAWATSSSATGRGHRASQAFLKLTESYDPLHRDAAYRLGVLLSAAGRTDEGSAAPGGAAAVAGRRVRAGLDPGEHAGPADRPPSSRRAGDVTTSLCVAEHRHPVHQGGELTRRILWSLVWRNPMGRPGGTPYPGSPPVRITTLTAMQRAAWM